MNWKEKLKKFYYSRDKYIKKELSENIDFTNVFDPYIDEKNNCPIMIIGEAPGINEVRLKQPFVGKAGENLDCLINMSGFERKKDFLITNAFPFRTYDKDKNRTPKAKELKISSVILKREIEIVKPKLVLLLGNSSIKSFSYLCADVKKLKKCGFYNVCNLNIGVCFHPSPIAFNRADIRKNLEKFFKKLKTVVGKY